MKLAFFTDIQMIANDSNLERIKMIQILENLCVGIIQSYSINHTIMFK